jgi:hypothetical protein
MKVKIFEDYFTELQADMVSICMEFSYGLADDIYIYCSAENKTVVGIVFFAVDDKVAELHELNELLFESGRQKTREVPSHERMEALSRIITNNLVKIFFKCKELKKEMPTEMKIYYNVATNSLKAEYQYELIHSNTNNVTFEDVFKWYEEEKIKRQKTTNS